MIFFNIYKLYYDIPFFTFDKGMLDRLIFVGNYILVFLTINAVLLYFCIIENEQENFYLAFFIFFYPFLKDSFYFVWEHVILNTLVVIDPHGGENEFVERNVLQILCVTNEDSIENFKLTLESLISEKFCGKRKIFIVNETMSDLTTISNRILPLYELMIVDKKVMVCSGFYKNNEILFCYFSNENETLSNHIVIQHIVENERRHFKPDHVLIVRCSESLSPNFVSRMSNIVMANPRVAVVCGIDIELNGNTMYQKKIKSGIYNKFGKYPFISDSRLLLYNVNHPSVMKRQVDCSVSIPILTHSPRTWVVMDEGSVRVNHVFNYHFWFPRYVELLFYSGNAMHIFVSILEIVNIITSLVRVLIAFFYIFAYDIISFPREDAFVWVAVSSVVISGLNLTLHFIKNPIVGIWTIFYQVLENMFHIPVVGLLLLNNILHTKRMKKMNDQEVNLPTQNG